MCGEAAFGRLDVRRFPGSEEHTNVGTTERFSLESAWIGVHRRFLPRLVDGAQGAVVGNRTLVRVIRRDARTVKSPRPPLCQRGAGGDFARLGG
jgi:hypothetical protein